MFIVSGPVDAVDMFIVSRPVDTVDMFIVSGPLDAVDMLVCNIKTLSQDSGIPGLLCIVNWN